MNNDKKSGYKSINTPVCDFLKTYAQSGAVRAHMPGHKGNAFVGGEEYDVTEIDGADSLYFADGIIRESEKNAGRLFGANTFYSTEGSSQCVKAMLRLISVYALQKGKKPLVLAARNVHGSFLSAVNLLRINVEWTGKTNGYLSCETKPAEVEKQIIKLKPTALYVTSPDYLGKTADIAALSAVCKKHGVLLAVDNAHGAYLKFLTPSRHAITLGADVCADSAHKTLPVLTGGAYLHVSHDASEILMSEAKRALLLFGSTSPSYLVLSSLDRTNAYLADGYTEKLAKFCKEVENLKNTLVSAGYTLYGDEPLKIAIDANGYGYNGKRLAKHLYADGIVTEFSDERFTVFMFTPENSREDLKKIEKSLLALPKKPQINDLYEDFSLPKRKMQPYEAFERPFEILPTREALGRTVCETTVKCPPATVLVAGGEVLDEPTVKRLIRYGYNEIKVIKE